MSETKAEQRLKELAWFRPHTEPEEANKEALLVGADALRLWREYLHHIDNARAADNMWTATAAGRKAGESEAAARALLTRAQE